MKDNLFLETLNKYSVWINISIIYRLIIEKKFDLYWSVLEKKTKIVKEPLFKDFIQKLLEPTPSKRITLDEIKRHPWMQGEIYTP